jgi:hypothetical protein
VRHQRQFALGVGPQRQWKKGSQEGQEGLEGLEGLEGQEGWK